MNGARQAKLASGPLGALTTSLTELGRRLEGDPLTSILLLLMIAGGIVVRIQGIAEPRFFSFDEGDFVKNAHAYLVGLRDQNDHPPLGKLLMTPGLLAFGNNSLGWRFAALCFGIQNLLVAYFLGRALFKSSRAGLFATAFLAADGFFIAYSRVAMLDGILTCLVLWSLLAAVTARNVLGVVMSAVLVGLATTVKWSGAFAAVPAVVAVLWLGQVPKPAILVFALAPLLHLGLWSLGLFVSGQPHDLRSLAGLMKDLFAHHLAKGAHDNAAASPWYTWLWMYHPIVVKLSLHGEASRYASSTGNPLLFYPATLLALALPLVTLVARYWQRARRALRRVDAEARRAALLLVLAWFSLFSPWIVARGKFTFMYHYLPSYGFALILVAGAVYELERRSRSAALWFSAGALIVAAFFVPVWAELPIDERAANARLVFKSWRP